MAQWKNEEQSSESNWKNKSQSSDPEWTNVPKSDSTDTKGQNKGSFLKKKCYKCGHYKGSHQIKRFDDSEPVPKDSSCTIDDCDCNEYQKNED